MEFLEIQPTSYFLSQHAFHFMKRQILTKIMKQTEMFSMITMVCIWIMYLDHGEKLQENQNDQSSEDRFQLEGIGVKLADETESSTNDHDQKSIEEQVVSIEVDQENNSEHAVVSICEVREEQVQCNSEAKNQTDVSESNTVSSSVDKENKTNSSTSMEMTFSVSQSNMLYGYYMCLTTFLILLNIFCIEGMFSSVISQRHIF